MNYTLSDHKHIFSAKNFLIALFLCAGILIQAQEGALDTTFNSAGTQPGVAVTIIGIDGAQNYTVAIQSNGRIITAGSNNSDFILARYLEDGTLDTNFGGTGPQPGVVTTPIGVGAMSLVNGLAIQADDKIIQAGTAVVDIAGNAGFALARYTPNGDLDTSFGIGGIVLTTIGSSSNTAAYGIALQLDGKIITAGTDNNNFVLARYNTDGSLDSTFGSGGIVITTLGVSTDSVAYGVEVQDDNKIIATGTDGLNFALARYLPNGSLDTTFNSAGPQPGVVITPIGHASFAYSGAVQADGKIISAGVGFLPGSVQVFALARYNTDGSLDASFGTGGIVTTTLASNIFLSANTVTIQANGKIVAAGRFTTTMSGEQYAIARYTTSGSLDTAFGINGVVVTSVGNDAVITGLAMQEDGKIIVAGPTSITGALGTIALARYLATPPLHPTIITSVSVSQPSQIITVSGTAQNQSIITLIIDGQLTNYTAITPLNSSSDESNTTGTWSIVIGMLSPGSHTIIASTYYKTGNVVLISNPPLLPPSSVQVQATRNIFLSQTELLNCITWTAPITGIAPVSYRIYRDVALTQRIAMVPASGPLLYCDQNRQKGVTYTYYIVSVDAENNVSTPVSATITS